MSQESQFLECLFQPRFRVLGREMLPMEVGHLLLLMRLEKLLLPPCYPGGGDLAVATYVCERPWDQACRDVQRAGWAYRQRIRWRASFGPPFERGLVEWREYVLWNLQAPTVRSRTSAAPGTGPSAYTLNAPFWLVYLNRARRAGSTFREAMSALVRLVLWESAAGQEEDGCAVWCSEEEMQIQRMLTDKRAVEELRKTAEEAVRNG